LNFVTDHSLGAITIKYTRALDKTINVGSHFPISEHSSTSQDELRLLITDCIAHSRVAQKKLYERYSPEAYGIVRKFVYNNESVAKEILNDSFYKVFKDLHKFSFAGSFEGWIRRIVINTAADHLRKNIRDVQPTKEITAEDAYINSGPVDNLSHKELLKIINTLPDAQREVFNLFVFENYSHKEIAKLLNLNQSNCRWHLNDARRRLKEKLKSFMK
jgi:RNA polymerase sigma factor (sigma-70 family)